MTPVRQKHVVFVGTSASIREMLDGIATQCGLPICMLGSVQDCPRRLVRENDTLIVMELDGNAAAGLPSLVKLTRQYPKVPVLVIVDRGDIRTTVQAMRAGAANCLEKPVKTELLTSAIDELLDRIDARSGDSVPLTPVEATVLRHILQGRTNRQIADALYRSPRTIEVHRRHIMRKLGASTIVDLIKAASARGFLRESNAMPQRPEADGRDANGPRRHVDTQNPEPADSYTRLSGGSSGGA